MLRTIGGLLVAALALTPDEPPAPPASGMVGIYAVIERVVLEPNDSLPTRAQVWGAFAYVDYGMSGIPIGQGVAMVTRPTTAAKRGYMYFSLPPQAYASSGPYPRNLPDLVQKEWADLKAVAGTGQAVAFGLWGYSGLFSTVELNHVRPESETPMSPAAYETNSGVVKLSEQGLHAEVISRLKAALKR
jgi:hypothetical protein